MAIGNGLCDPVHMLKYGDYLYQIGLIDVNGRAVFHEMENLGMKYIQEKKWNEAFDVSYRHCDYDLLYYQIMLCLNMDNSEFQSGICIPSTCVLCVLAPFCFDLHLLFQR